MKKKDNTLIMVESGDFGGTQCNFWQNAEGDIFMTREQVGDALEYADPVDSVEAMHRRHKNVLDKHSVSCKIKRVEGSREVERELVLYNELGIYQLCRFSRQPKADKFMDWVFNVIQNVRKTGGYTFSLPDFDKDLLTEEELTNIDSSIKYHTENIERLELQLNALQSLELHTNSMSSEDADRTHKERLKEIETYKSKIAYLRKYVKEFEQVKEAHLQAVVLKERLLTNARVYRMQLLDE